VQILAEQGAVVSDRAITGAGPGNAAIFRNGFA
jgi:hypothetical protein